MRVIHKHRAVPRAHVHRAHPEPDRLHRFAANRGDDHRRARHFERDRTADPDQALLWQYDFVEAFPAARKIATRSPDMLEIKTGIASCGMVQQMAIWEHPPVTGSAVCEYTVAVPPELNALKLRFAVGIRDGALMEGDNMCAFRVVVNGVRLWSITKQTNPWERYLLDLPSLAGQDMVIQFMTDGLGDNRWNWAVWGEPLLLGYGPKRKRGK